MARRIVHGDDLLYRFFRDLLEQEPELSKRVPHLMVAAMGVWLPLDLYYELPVLLPWVVRDPTCRKQRATSKRPERPDQWSAPNAAGFQRDDNSMVKSLPRNLDIRGPRGAHLDGSRMGSEFVASHIWREVRAEELASRSPLLNTFIPNLVWLPAQVSKLSDLEGRDVQNALKSMSWSIYRKAPVRPGLEEVVDEAWSLLPEPPPRDRAPLAEELNWFCSTPAFVTRKMANVRLVIDALEALAAGSPLERKIVSTRYTEGLPTVSANARSDLRDWLVRFVPDQHPAVVISRP